MTGQPRIDNFQRHLYFTIGAAIGVTFAAIAGWAFALGWLIVAGPGLLALFAWSCGYVRFVRRPGGGGAA